MKKVYGNKCHVHFHVQNPCEINNLLPHLNSTLGKVYLFLALCFDKIALLLVKNVYYLYFKIRNLFIQFVRSLLAGSTFMLPQVQTFLNHSITRIVE